MKQVELLSQKRFVLKISGEFLGGQHHETMCWSVLDKICLDMKKLSQQWGWVIVLGGGNFFRGRDLEKHLPCAGTRDTVGMLGTVMNSVIFAERLAYHGVSNTLFTASSLAGVGQPFHVKYVHEALEKGHVVLCAGGLGHGATTTDTAAVVRACELNIDCVLKATRVNGVYSHNPDVFPEATRYETLTYRHAIDTKLEVMDLSAMALAWEHYKKTVVFSLNDQEGGLLKLFNPIYEKNFSTIASVIFRSL